jgi:Ni/Co efflux regulator RcnB
MKKVLTAAIAATLALGSVGIASAAEAQSRGADRYEQRQDRRDDRRDDRADRRDDRRDDRADRRDQRQDQRAYARWQRSEHRYNAGRYTPPRGHQARAWAYGQRMPANYRGNQYVVRDYNRYGLRQPPSGYQYVRSGNDVVLAAVATGLITAVIAGLFN